tara:strand:- start:1747 stop:2331 length:585 start_codon:yes stop_codon:yes gene_type:complete
MLEESVHEDHEKSENATNAILEGAKKTAGKLKHDYNVKAEKALNAIHKKIKGAQDENDWDAEEADHLYDQVHDIFYTPEHEASEDEDEEEEEEEEEDEEEEASEEEEEEEEVHEPPTKKSKSKKTMSSRPPGRAPKGKTWSENKHQWVSMNARAKKASPNKAALAVRRIAPLGKKWNNKEGKWVSTNTYLRRLE